jgi:uncharacterized membrane protein
MRTEDLANEFLKLSVVNGFLAFVFTVPILDPSLCIATPPGLFGCISTMDINWPGTWVLVAWIVWVLVAVLGALFFGVSYYFMAKFWNKTKANNLLSTLHLVVFEVGVFGACGMMAAIGYVGGSFIAHGGNAIVSSAVIAAYIIPPLSSDPTNVLSDMPPVVEAAFIGLTLLGILIGLINWYRLRSD